MMADQSLTRIRFFSRIFPCGREMRERRQPLLGQDRRSLELVRARTAALGSTSQSFGGAAKARAQEPWEMCEYRSPASGARENPVALIQPIPDFFTRSYAGMTRKRGRFYLHRN